jgi:hypothetical protein
LIYADNVIDTVTLNTLHIALHMAHYTKLWSFIVASTIWGEDDKTRIVWITMLASAERDGHVMGTPPGLARLANVSLPDCVRALDKLKAPDPDSNTKDKEGRRIEDAPGGWLIINYIRHREAADEEAKREANRKRVAKHRAKKKAEQPRILHYKLTEYNTPPPE